MMLLLDGICETLVLCKFMSCFLADDPADKLINYKRETMKEWVSRGYMGLQAQLDRKLERWYQMSKARRKRVSATQAHLQAILGTKKAPKVREGPQTNIKRGRPTSGLDKDAMIQDMVDGEPGGHPINPKLYEKEEDDE
jgi:hypothetical protein